MRTTALVTMFLLAVAIGREQLASAAPPAPACAPGEWLAEYFPNGALTGKPVLTRCESTAPNYDWGNGAPDPRLPIDTFSARWTTQATFIGGVTTFTTTGDDGVRLFVDGVRVINNWRYQPVTVKTAAVTLAPGSHAVKFEYFESGGGAVARLAWSPNGGTPPPPPPPPPPSCPDNQWLGEYFANSDLLGSPALTRCETTAPNADWGAGAPAAGLPVDGFSVRWTGSPSFPAGPVTFTTRSDDGVRLSLDGQRLIDNWTYHSLAVDRASTVVTAGRHRIQMEFFDGGGGAVASLQWTDANTPRPAQITTFTATPASLPAGQRTTLAWDTLDAATCAASGGWTGARHTAGTEVVSPGVTTTYVLTCANAVGQTVVATATATVSGGGAPARWVSGYYAGYFWDWTGPNPAAALAAVDMSTMTHLIFARYAPGGGTLGGSPGTVVDGAGTGHEFVEQPLIAKAHTHGVKALLMLGGAGDGAGFDASTATAVMRTQFIQNIMAALVAHDYDGIDVDWEEHLDTAAQRDQVLAFLEELRAASAALPRYQAPNAPLLITWPAFWTTINYPTVTAWHAQVASLVDQYNLMTYSMSGDWGGWESWHHSPLAGAAATHPTSIESSVQEYLAAGIPRAKLGIGIGLYGIYYTGGVTGPRQPLGVSRSQVDDGENNYQRLVADGAFAQAGGTRHWDDEAKQSYYSYSPAWNRYGNTPITYLTYEDEQSIAAKGQWVRDNGLGGTIVWMVNYGYLGAARGNPLMVAVRDAFLGGAAPSSERPARPASSLWMVLAVVSATTAGATSVRRRRHAASGWRGRHGA